MYEYTDDASEMEIFFRLSEMITLWTYKRN